MFYFTLGNLPPRTRSKLNCIYLVSILKQKVLSKYGMHEVMRPFLADVRELVSDVRSKIHGHTCLTVSRNKVIHST